MSERKTESAKSTDEAPLREDEERKTFAEESDSLWLITLGPLIWILHFLICYGLTAMVCAKLGGNADWLQILRIVIAVVTIIALGGIGITAWRAWRQWDFLDDFDYSHGLAFEEDRHEFLGHASFMLAIVSFIGVVYVALPALFMRTCL